MQSFAILILGVFGIGSILYLNSMSVIEISNDQYKEVAQITQEANAKGMKTVSDLSVQAMKDQFISKSEYQHILNHYAKAQVILAQAKS